MSIPIRNIYFLLCYAWDCFPEGSAIAVGQEESPDLRELLAKVLITASHQLLRRGLDRDYVHHDEDTRHPRGRIDLNETVKRSLRSRGQLACRFDELNPNVLHNQILKTTIGRLHGLGSLDKNLRRELGILYRQLGGIDEIRLSRHCFKRVRLHGNNRYYRLVINICALVNDATLPAEDGSGYLFADLLEDEARMSRIFEAFVRNFYAHEQNAFRLGTRRIEWDLENEPGPAAAVLPDMYNDIRLETAEETIIIDTKYYQNAMKAHFGRDILQPQNLYQIYSYLKNAKALLPANHIIRGILLYPASSKQFDVIVPTRGNPIRAYTLNLSQSWQAIRSDLLGLLTRDNGA